MRRVYEDLGKELQVSCERLARKNACDFEMPFFSLRVSIKLTVKALEIQLLHPL